MSRLEEQLALQLRAASVPSPEREARLVPGRRFRTDFAWHCPHWLAVEVEGGVWSRGRHVRGQGFEQDCEKYALVALAGYRVLRVTASQIDDGRALAWICEALAQTADHPRGGPKDAA